MPKRLDRIRCERGVITTRQLLQPEYWPWYVSECDRILKGLGLVYVGLPSTPFSPTMIKWPNAVNRTLKERKPTTGLAWHCFVIAVRVLDILRYLIGSFAFFFFLCNAFNCPLSIVSIMGLTICSISEMACQYWLIITSSITRYTWVISASDTARRLRLSTTLYPEIQALLDGICMRNTSGDIKISKKEWHLTCGTQ